MHQVSAQSSDITTEPGADDWWSNRALLLKANNDQSNNINENIYFAIGQNDVFVWWNTVKCEIQYEGGVGTRSGMFMDWDDLVLCGDWDNSETDDNIIFGFDANKVSSSTFKEKMRLTDEGLLGIGLTNPSYKLHVAGASSDPKGGLFMLGALGGASLRMGYHANYSWIQSHGGKPLYINPLPDNNTIINRDFGGNVGIGTESPTVKLDVNGKIRIRGGLPGYGKVLTCDGTGLADWQFLPSPYWSEHGNNVYYNKGNVGIGTVSPTAKLDVNGTIKIRGGSPGAGKVLTSDANGLADWQILPLSTTKWSENGTNVYYNEGNVGIGTESPTAKLDVNGTIKIRGGSPGAGKVLTSDANGLADWQILPLSTTKWSENGTNVYYNEGNVGIGTESPTAKLDVNGTIKIRGGSPGAGKILTSDANGLATWNDPISSTRNIKFENLSDTYQSPTMTFNFDGLPTNTPWGVISSQRGLAFFVENDLAHEKVSLYIDSIGVVGINSNRPLTDCSLTVEGHVHISPKDTPPTRFNDNYSSEYLLWVEKGIVSHDFVLAKPENWGDEVFEEDYDLFPLNDLESYIKENKHLPDVPSEKEVIENGYKISDINVMFMKKIEELTLYVIEQNKEIEAMKARLNKQGTE